MLRRPPIVTVLGHVNHGKTTLLDYLHRTHVAATEHGGITQHIRAFHLPGITSGRRGITFIDTPGHAAFSNLRSRGAHLTDLVLLVVALDDGPLQTTIEAVQLIKNNSLSCILTLTKLDIFSEYERQSQIQKVLKAMKELEITAEALGGPTQAVTVSARTGENIPHLLQAIETEAELLEDLTTYDPNAPFEGGVMEVREDAKLGGLLAAVIGKQGVLRPGQFLAAEGSFAKVRSILDDNHRHMTQLTPSIPALVTGWKELVHSGSSLQVVSSQEEAEQLAQTFRVEQTVDPAVLKARLKQEELIRKQRAYDIKLGVNRPRNTFDYAPAGQEYDASVLLKTDTMGSFEAITGELRQKYPRIQLIPSPDPLNQVSLVEEKLLASTPNTHCFVFNRPINIKGPQVYIFKSIYDLVQKAKSITSPERIPTATLKVLKMFHEHKGRGTLIGAKVTDGRLKANHPLEASSDVVYEIDSIKQGRDSVESVGKGGECGLILTSQKSVINITEGSILLQYQQQRKL